MIVVGLSGYAQSGKDTVYSILKEYGFVRVSFADALRDMLYALNPLLTCDPYSGIEIRVAEHVDAVGWERAKQTPEVRALLQRLGTDAGRKVLGENIWVDAAMRKLPGGWGAYCFTDVRFPNEFEAIRDVNGKVWRVCRPDTEPVNAHPSETALDGFRFDGVIVNDGDIAALRSKVERALGV